MWGGSVFMACPICGSDVRRLIAPGYYQCTADVVIGVTGDNLPVPGECGHRYQDGGGSSSHQHADLCACQTIAIRYCGRCSTPLCGDHGATFDGRWHCSPCVKALKEQEKREAAHLKQSLQRAYQQLPEVTEEELRPWIAGKALRGSFEDGVTHQTSTWTGARLARLLAQMLGENNYQYIVRGFDGKHSGSTYRPRWIGDSASKVEEYPDDARRNPRAPRGEKNGDIVLRPSGEVVRLKYYSSGEYGTYSSGCFGERRAESAAPFNSARFGDSDPTPNRDAFRWVRQTYPYNVDNVARIREQQLAQRRAERQHARSSATKTVLFLVVLVVLVVLIISAL